MKIVATMAVVAAMALVSCSPRKNNAATRKYQEFITRYNIHFNGDTHYKETLKEMETVYEDDYSRLLFIHPAEAKADDKAPQPQGNFDRSIEKAQKAIQLRSIKKKPKKKSGRSSDPAYKAWMKREEYNPFLHNSWMMMGRSQYMNGDFLGSASDLGSIIHHSCVKPPAAATAALDHQLRVFCQQLLHKVIQTDHKIVGHLTLPGLHGIEIRKTSVHIPLDILDIALVKHPADLVENMLPHILPRKIKHQLVPAPGRIPARILHRPIRMLPIEVAVLGNHLRLDPDAKFNALFIDSAHQFAQTASQLLLIHLPVT